MMRQTRVGKVTFIIFAASLPLYAEGSSSLADLILGGSVDDVKDTLATEAENYRKTLDSDIQTLLRAIPGEQWEEATYWVNQDCSKFSGDQNACKQKQTESQQFLLNSSKAGVGNVQSTQEQYELTISFEGKQVDWSQIRINAYQTYFADISGVQARNFVAEHFREQTFDDDYPSSEGNFVSRPITKDEVAQKVENAGNALFGGLLTPQNAISFPYGIIVNAGEHDNFILRGGCGGWSMGNRASVQACSNAAFKHVQQMFTQTFKDAVLAPYQEVVDTRMVGGLVFPWTYGVVAEDAVVVLPEDELDMIFGTNHPGTSIKLWIHKKGDPNAMPNYASKISIGPEDFDKSLAFDEPVGKHRKMVYTIKTVVPPGITDNRAIVEQLLAEREEAQKLQNVYAQPGKPAARPWWRTFISNAFVVAVFLNALVILGAIVFYARRFLRRLQLKPA